MAISSGQVREALTATVEALGYDLEDVTVTAAGRRSVVRVVVDRDGGLDLDAVAEVSREVSGVLDTSDAVGNAPYVLEVTSPGVDRPLTEPRHWRRNVGRMVEAGDRAGRITLVDDTGVTLEVDGQTETVSFGDLDPGHVQVEFSHSLRTGGDAS